MRRTKKEEQIKEYEDKLFAAYLGDQSEENKAAIIAYMETQRPPLIFGWVRYMRKGDVKAVYNYEEKIWQVFVIEEVA